MAYSFIVILSHQPTGAHLDPGQRYLLRALLDRGVEFFVVGGLDILKGAPADTFDLDVVHSRWVANIPRLLSMLETIDAVYSFQSYLRKKPTTTHLPSPGHQVLTTRYGRLNLLGSICDLGYEDLIQHTIEFDIEDGLGIRVLDLETIIAIKEELGGEEDRTFQSSERSRS